MFSITRTSQTGQFWFLFPNQSQLFPKTCLPQTTASFPQNLYVTQRQFIKQTEFGQSNHLKIFPKNPFPQTTAIFPKKLEPYTTEIYLTDGSDILIFRLFFFISNIPMLQNGSLLNRRSLDNLTIYTKMFSNTRTSIY